MTTQSTAHRLLRVQVHCFSSHVSMSTSVQAPSLRDGTCVLRSSTSYIAPLTFLTQPAEKISLIRSPSLSPPTPRSPLARSSPRELPTPTTRLPLLSSPSPRSPTPRSSVTLSRPTPTRPSRTSPPRRTSSRRRASLTLTRPRTLSTPASPRSTLSRPRSPSTTSSVTLALALLELAPPALLNKQPQCYTII